MVGCVLALAQGDPAEAARKPGAAAGGLTVQYEWSVITVGPRPDRQQRGFYFWRDPRSVETMETNGLVGAVWSRLDGDAVALDRVFHAERHVVEFQPADLRASGQHPSWKHLASIVNPDLLGRELVSTNAGPKEWLGRPVQSYQGKVGGGHWELLWFKDEALPARLQQVFSDRIVLLKAIEAFPTVSAPWKRRATDGYRRTDFSDLADMEKDPAVRRLSLYGLNAHSHCVH